MMKFKEADFIRTAVVKDPVAKMVLVYLQGCMKGPDGKPDEAWVDLSNVTPHAESWDGVSEVSGIHAHFKVDS